MRAALQIVGRHFETMTRLPPPVGMRNFIYCRRHSKNQMPVIETRAEISTRRTSIASFRLGGDRRLLWRSHEADRCSG